MVQATLALLWAFTWVTVALIATRLLLRKVRRKAFVAGDYLSMAAILCALIRLALVHVIILWGTNNMAPKMRSEYPFTAQEIYQREIGSKLTLVNRIFYNSYLWLQKLVLLDTYRLLIRNLPWERPTLLVYMGLFAATYVTVQVVTFTECDPFNHYWQVLPDPGTCSRAQLQLIVVGVLNVVTDAMLIALPLPVLIMVKRSMMEKLQLTALFAIGFFIVAITIIRLPQNAQNSTKQVNRTTWASVELLAAAIVANAPVLYGFYHGHREESRSRATATSSGPHSSRDRALVSHDQPWEMNRVSHSRQPSMLGSKLAARPAHTYTEINGECGASVNTRNSWEMTRENHGR
ncbi:hypothetical protein EYZ11_004499 [Aspergillus tanneri]|uniref:Rhodopsin domain-containing protein n=1 Tax=Aspergillus tanneri TaxID=1220188 RepID=A0A4S3JKD3_9EURO|nr:uncharacterized protein ATNIH1004_009178 [Aspergillus tanneri]KAA8644967.1 hypothetical protein ATNIH1004_009178 [Aspergillus tanneri]THC96039.1 hypothetical protein EYZ11_004499 [Aspergillus tanneri]